MSPNELRELLAEMKAEVTEINSAWGVIDDTHLGNTLESKSKDDNIFLVGVLPSYGSEGTSADNVKQNTACQFLILEKTSYSELTPDQFWEVFEKTYQAIEKIKGIILRKASEECLPYLYNIDVNSINIDPVRHKAECNGYSIDFEIA
ncbi:hypothetical protein [Elizabethkingia anophelis]|uniref:hypothetical protein n=1 Tax=Elizabethkingia anophelis TaxID=1117645 RepID=UPI00066651D9|nr:hypothetical protein [Elizabethkingia anophelis]